jgi:hypothetical protein
VTSVAFVTKSYGPDRERCELLARSIRLLAPGTRHWIIVDARDRGAFRSLEDGPVRIVTTEELLPQRVRRLGARWIGLDKNVWVGLGVRPMRGWLVQQLAKLAIGLVADEDILIHADSDVALVRPFANGTAPAPDRLPLLRLAAAVGDGLPDHVRWHRTAERLLGLPARPLPLPDYIGGLVPWRRETLAALLDAIETRSARHWMRTLAHARHVSEYILYGRFVEDVLGDEPGDGRSLCHCYWGTEPLTRAELDRFVDETGDDEIGVMISAKAGMNPADYADVLERRWAAHRW